MCWKDGAVHEGEFKDNKKHGQGKMKWANGKQYEGSWEMDVKQGYGVFK